MPAVDPQEAADLQSEIYSVFPALQRGGDRRLPPGADQEIKGDGSLCFSLIRESLVVPF